MVTRKRNKGHGGWKRNEAKNEHWNEQCMQAEGDSRCVVKTKGFYGMEGRLSMDLGGCCMRIMLS
jgi:hypothetical protein